MATSNSLQNRRIHNLLLISKLLSCRENASPFTLILDSLEQSAKGLLREMIKRANASKIEVIYISFSTLRQPKNVQIYIQAHNLTPAELQKKIVGCVKVSKRASLIVFDTLHPLLTNTQLNIPSFLSTFTTPTTSLLAVYHTDVPLPAQLSTYTPPPLVLLKYLATTILTVQSLHHVLAQKAARDKSVGEPMFGLDEGIEGVLVGMQGERAGGVVCEMEYRRKSGRSVIDVFFVPISLHAQKETSSLPGKQYLSAIGNRDSAGVILLEDHPLYATPAASEEVDGVVSTFDLGLTEKQRRDREGVVLPYFDAQENGGGGEGGRILYDLGVEDDFDEEEDEI